MGAKIIAFINFKGGVGKTANVVNIGAALAKYHDRKVLIDVEIPALRAGLCVLATPVPNGLGCKPT